MSKIDLMKHDMLMKEARSFLREAGFGKMDTDTKKGITVLTEEDLYDWLLVFEADRVKLDGCNQVKVLR